MRQSLEKVNRFLDAPLDVTPRVLLALAFLPFDAGYRTLGIESDFDSPEIIASALSNTLHASIFWGYVLTALIIGTLLVHGRDAD